MSRAITEKSLMEKVIKMLPKGIPAEAIDSVEVDIYGNSDRADGISYWVYFRPGFKTEGGYGCHTVHEDTLKEIKYAVSDVVYCPDDDPNDGYGEPLENFPCFVGMTFYDGTISATIDNVEVNNYGGNNNILEIHTRYGWVSIELGLFGKLPESWKVYNKEEGKYLSCIEL